MTQPQRGPNDRPQEPKEQEQEPAKETVLEAEPEQKRPAIVPPPPLEQNE